MPYTAAQTPTPNLNHPHLPEFITRRLTHYYQERVVKECGGRFATLGRQPEVGAVQLMSNDYLALARHPAILSAQARSLEKQGNGMLMSAVFLSGPNPQWELEQELARFMCSEETVLSQSGWCANVGLIQSIAEPKLPVYIDRMAHTSLWDGIRAAGAIPRPFRHNDAEHLERQIRRHGFGVVAVDSVYSTDGSVAPLTEIVEVSERHDCALVVDESHSLGTHGPRGAGLVVELGLANRVHFRTASLAKAFAGRAGIIACGPGFGEYYTFEALPSIFSSALLPHELVGLHATLKVIEREQWRRERLHRNAEQLRNALLELGYNVQASRSQIIGLEAGNTLSSMMLRNLLEEQGVFGAIFVPPATPRNRTLVRFSVHAGLDQDDLQTIIDACRQVREPAGMADWPSTRRM